MTAQAGLCLVWSETPEDTCRGSDVLGWIYTNIYLLNEFKVYSQHEYPEENKLFLRQHFVTQKANANKESQRSLAVEPTMNLRFKEICHGVEYIAIYSLLYLRYFNTICR